MTEEIREEMNQSTPETEETPAPTPEKEEGTEKKSKKDKAQKAETAALRAQVEALAAELAEQKDQHLRLAAEYENFRRRTAKEKEGIYTDATFAVLADLLPVVDNLERAAASEGDAAAIAEGVRMTLRSVEDMLTRLHVESYGARGDEFDPNYHNAVMHGEDETLGENQISDVFQKGYRKEDKVLRYAMVKVVN